jgi:hypothetical protein
MRIAAECLSICVGNPSIRQAILEVEQHIMFIWLLQSEDYDIRVNGALASAKFAAIDKVKFKRKSFFFFFTAKGPFSWTNSESFVVYCLSKPEYSVNSYWTCLSD